MGKFSDLIKEALLEMAMDRKDYIDKTRSYRRTLLEHIVKSQICDVPDQTKKHWSAEIAAPIAKMISISPKIGKLKPDEMFQVLEWSINDIESMMIKVRKTFYDEYRFLKIDPQVIKNVADRIAKLADRLHQQSSKETITKETDVISDVKKIIIGGKK